MLLFFLPTHTDSLSGSNNDEKENVDPSVSIPAPSAPRKQQARKKQAAVAMSAAWSNGNMSLCCHLPNLTLLVDDPFFDGGVSTVTPDVMDSESSDDEHLSDASGLEDMNKTPQVLNRTLIKEVRVGFL